MKNNKKTLRRKLSKNKNYFKNASSSKLRRGGMNLGNNNQDSSLDSFNCPITTSIMIDPVICTDGHSYERTAITEWLGRGKTTSPVTREHIENILIPNHTLRQAIEEFAERKQRLMSRILPAGLGVINTSFVSQMTMGRGKVAPCSR